MCAEGTMHSSLHIGHVRASAGRRHNGWATMKTGHGQGSGQERPQKMVEAGNEAKSQSGMHLPRLCRKVFCRWAACFLAASWLSEYTGSMAVGLR